MIKRLRNDPLGKKLWGYNLYTSLGLNCKIIFWSIVADSRRRWRQTIFPRPFPIRETAIITRAEQKEFR